MTETASPRRRWPRRLLVLLAIIALIAGSVFIALHRAPLVTLPDAPPAVVVIRDVRVIDVIGGEALAHRDVRIEGADITAVEAHAPDGDHGRAWVIDGAGKTLVPGLIDAHCHVDALATAPWDLSLPDTDLALERLLFSGVTRVFDPGAASPDIFDLRDAIAKGERLGPTLHAAGPILTAPGGHPIPMFRELAPSFLADGLIEGAVREVAGPADARAAVAPIAARQPTAIKLVVDALPTEAPTLSVEQARAVVDAAREQKLRTVAHIGTTADALAAGRAGVAAWVHGVYKEPIPEPEITSLAAFGIPMAPTMVVFWSYARMGRADYPPTDLERAVASDSMLDARAEAPDDFVPQPQITAYIDLVARNEQALAGNVRRLAAAGVTMLAGSDCQAGVIHGPALHRELALMVDAGLSPLDALRAATVSNARFLSEQDDPPYGVVAAGKRADLVLVGGDPLQDVGALADIHTVILGGVPLVRHPLR